MSTKELFSKTLPFVWAKLAVGAALVVGSIILLAICLGLGSLFGGTGLGFMILVWIVLVNTLRFVLMHYVGYMIKAGHIAVIAEATSTGAVPENPLNYGKEQVTKKFATANVYFAIDKLVTGAVKQIQKGVGKVGDLLGAIPGMNIITSLVQFFVSISLGYIDECCFGWCFLHPEDSAFKSSADGVVIFAQNWKKLLASAAKTMLKVVLACVVIALIIFIPIGAIFTAFNWNRLLAFLVACLIAWVVKYALMDSYIMIQMMAAYLTVAPETEITFDLYDKLCKMSSKFKELLEKAQDEQPIARPAMAKATTTMFCSSCGTQVSGGAKFCPKCGKQL